MQSAVKTDRRIVRTKHAIRTALADLLSQKDITAITISELAQAAAISRKTFYNYYNTIYDVLDEIEIEIVAEFKRAMQDTSQQDEPDNLARVFRKLTLAAQDSLELYGHLMRFDRTGELVSKAVTAIKQEIKVSLLAHTGVSEEDANLMLDYVLWGLLTVYQVWYHSDHSRTFEQITAAIGVLTWQGCKGYLESLQK